MSPVSAPMLPLGNLPQGHGAPRDQLAKAAQQFEAIFVRQMLAAARKTDFGGDNPLGGQALNTFREMQDDRFADVAAQNGSFGLARMIEAQLASQLGNGSERASTGSARAGVGQDAKPAQPELVEGHAQVPNGRSVRA